MAWIHVPPQKADTPWDLKIEQRCRSWETAGALAAHLQDSPPPGYVLRTAQVSRAKSPSGGAGKRCGLELVFEYRDDREKYLSWQEARTWFVPFEAMGQGRSPIPSIPSADERQAATSSSPRS